MCLRSGRGRGARRQPGLARRPHAGLAGRGPRDGGRPAPGPGGRRPRDRPAESIAAGGVAVGPREEGPTSPHVRRSSPSARRTRASRRARCSSSSSRRACRRTWPGRSANRSGCGSISHVERGSASVATSSASRPRSIVDRNHFGPPGRRADLEIVYAEGGDRDACLANPALLSAALPPLLAPPHRAPDPPLTTGPAR